MDIGKEKLLERIAEQEEQISKLKNEVSALKIFSVTAIHDKLRLPNERGSIVHYFTIGDKQSGKGYLTIGKYADRDEIGELFIKWEHGPTVECSCKDQDIVAENYAFMKGILNQFAIAVSIGLQYGVPLQAYIEKFKYCRFPPYGNTSNDKIKFATSIIDYIFRYLEYKFVK